MDIVVMLAAAIAFVAVFRKPLQKHPGIFYAIAVALDLLLVVGSSLGLPVMLWRVVLQFHSRCLFAFALFAVVMFIGVLRNGSALKVALLPIRAELSIFAAILAAGHILNFAVQYVLRLLGGADAAILFAIVVAAMITVLLVPLTITSFKAVKRRMSAVSWKRLQRFAYLFWGLVFVHVLLILGPSAASGAATAIESIVVYAALFAAYAILRIYRAIADARARESGDAAALPALSSEDAPAAAI